VKRFGIVIGLLLLLLIGGGLTSLLIANSGGGFLPFLRTVSSPEASSTVMTGWKANQLFALVGFILFNLIGMAVTAAIVVWLLDRGVRRSIAEGRAAAAAAKSNE
jgi:hypothetical protein